MEEVPEQGKESAPTNVDETEKPSFARTVASDLFDTVVNQSNHKSHDQYTIAKQILQTSVAEKKEKDKILDQAIAIAEERKMTKKQQEDEICGLLSESR